MLRLGWMPDFAARYVIQVDDASSLELLTSCVDAAIASGRFAFDTETTGLEVLDGARMFMASFSWLDDNGRECKVGKHGTVKISSCAVFIGKRHAEIKLSTQDAVLAELSRLLSSNAKCQMFNAKFDVKVCWADGVPTNNLEQDVMLSMYVLDPGFGDALEEVRQARKSGTLSTTQPLPRNLKDLSTLLLGWPAEERDEIHGWLTAKFGKSRAKWKFNAVPADLVAVYACSDTERTLALSIWAEHALKEREQWDLALMEAQLACVVAEMELNGLPLNLDAIEAADKEWTERGLQANNKLLELTGLTQLSVMSQDDLASYAWPALQERAKELKRVVTKTEQRDKAGGAANTTVEQARKKGEWGAPQETVSYEELSTYTVPENWDVDSLSMYAVRKRGSTKITAVPETGIFGEFCAAVLTKRMADKIVGTYFDPWRKVHMRQDDNGIYRLHPQLRQDGTDTGRFSSKDPNLQNVPSDARMGGFTSYEGYVAWCKLNGYEPAPARSLVFIDYSQVEYRVFAHYAGGEVLDKYKLDPTTDFHQALADLLGIDRKPAKNLNFGVLYGMGKDKLIEALSGQMPPERALYCYNLYHQKFPQAKQLYYEAQRRCKERGWIKNLFGRRRYLDQKFAHVAFNTIIQGSAADIVKRAMLRVHATLPTLDFEAKMLLQIHDELIFETPTGTEHALIEALRGPMTDEPRLNCPLLIDAAVALPGEVWRDKHPLELA